MNPASFTSALLLLLLASGCYAHRYHDAVADLSYQGDTRVAVATRDARPYILNADKSPTFVGLQRGGYGNPFDVDTESGQPLAFDMTASIAASLSRQGFQVVAVTAPPAGDEADFLAKLAESGAERLLLLTLTQWKADAYQNTALLYDVLLQVRGADQSVLAEKRLEGQDNLGGSFWNPVAHAREAVPIAFSRKLKELLDDPAVAAALRGP